MPETEALGRSLLRNPDLAVAAVYERDIDACLAGVWENVYDWEHLPWLHDQAFTSIRMIESGDWGWSAELGFPGGEQSIIELVTDREAGRYVARTVQGAGAPSEIWTSLRSEGEADDSQASTQICVEFCVSPLPEEILAKIGKTYLAVYAELWDQDEEMMQTRADRRIGAEGSMASPSLSPSPSPPPPPPPPPPSTSMSVDLGLASDLRQRVPICFDFGGHSFRLFEDQGTFLAHSTECPHWGGPLAECEIEKGEITCPWHGYRFEVADGCSSEGRSLRLRPAPRIFFDASSGRLTATN